MDRALESFPFCSIHKEKLKKAGYEVARDLNDVSPDALSITSKEIDISISEAKEILSHTAASKYEMCPGETRPFPSNIGGKSALDLLTKEETIKRVITFSQSIDKMLEGGVPVTKVTEVCGPPGIGKTQLCIQLAVDATIPSVFGGPGGESIYIDTEGSFIVQRVAQVAKATVRHVQLIASSSTNEAIKREASQFTFESILSKMHYYRCHTHLQLIALTNVLHSFISEHQSVCLIVVDSVASPFRHGFKDLSHRSRLLSGLTQNMIKLAIESELAVVFTNQVTTRAGSSSNEQSRLVPALGDSWGHAPNIRVMLYWEEGERHAYLFKSPSCRETRVKFQITVDGVRDISVSTPTSHLSPVTGSRANSSSSYEKEQELDSLFQDISVYLDAHDETDMPSSKRCRVSADLDDSRGR